MDHAGYLAATVTALRDDGLHLADVDAAEQPRRTLTVRLSPTQPGGAYGLLAAITACWDDRDGWSLILDGETTTTTLYRGGDLIPAPTVVAAWISLALTAPAMVTSHEHDLPLAVDNLEQLLANYSGS